jgi:excisionase family DNA binding protein
MPATRQKKPTRNIPPKPAEPVHPTVLYTYEEAAGHLQMTPREVRDMVHDGQIGRVELNRRQWRVQGRQLLEYIDRKAKAAIR